MYKMSNFLFKNGLADYFFGVGQLLIGAAAVYTLFQANGILEDIRLIRDDATYIRRLMESQKEAVANRVIEKVEAGTPAQKILGEFKVEDKALPGELYMKSNRLNELKLSIENKSLSKGTKRSLIIEALSLKRGGPDR
ncbi:MAG TPA: hypothetical protein DD412_07240 [Holosporales bacterium]|nr:hypothetical protein [Holosporales bacterium]